MRPTIPIILLAFLLSACGPKDTDYETRRKLAGTWTVYKWTMGNEEEPDPGTTIVYKTDGTFETFANNTHLKHPLHLKMSGTWNVTNNKVFMTLTNAGGDNRHEAIGSVDQCEIIRLDDHDLIYTWTNDFTQYLRKE